MKAFFTVITFFIKMGIWIGGYPPMPPMPVGDTITWEVKSSTEWGAIQTGSNSVSMTKNVEIPQSGAATLHLIKEASKGLNWDGMVEWRPYSGVDMYVNKHTTSVEAYVDFSGLQKGAWAGFWMHNNQCEFDFEVWMWDDDPQLKVTYHWENGKGKRYMFVLPIPFIEKGLFRFDISGRWVKAYINDKLVYVFKKKESGKHNICFSLYALSIDGDEYSRMIFDNVVIK